MLNMRIRTARVRAGLTQQALADSVGVSRTAVSNWESSTGGVRPTSEKLERICHSTNVSWEWLATGRGGVSVAPEAAPAVDAEIIDDLIERRLLRAFRGAESEFKRALLTLAEAGVRSRRR